MPKGTVREISTYRTLTKDFKLQPRQAYYIIFKYAPEELENCPTTYEGLQKRYPTYFEGITQRYMDSVMNYEHVNNAIMWLLKKLDRKRDIELYNIYYNLAKEGDTQALKAYMDFKKTFFANSETSELQKIVEGANIDISDDEDEDFSMEI